MNSSVASQAITDSSGAPMTRWKASGIHLLSSACIAGLIVALMLSVWYPWPLFEAAGGSELTMILVGVDVVLGPLVTLIVFKAGKRGLIFDLAFIVLAQISALAYGVHVVYVSRPAYLVYNIDRFDLVTAVQLDPRDLAKAARTEFRSPPVDGPQYVAAVLPADPGEQQRILDSALQGKDLILYPQYYVPYEQEAKNARRHAKALDPLLKRDSSGAVMNYLESSGRARDTVAFLPLRARNVDGVVLLDAASGNPLKIVLIDPW